MTSSFHADQIELRADPVTRDTIDVNDGIERVMGKRDLYARMLRRFRDDYPGGVVPIAAAIASGDQSLAHRISISLKGITGMIGAHRLHGHACELEEALRLQRDSSAIMRALALEFDKVLKVLDVLLEGSPPEGQPLEINMRPLLGDDALLHQLAELLRNEDGAAVDMLEESAASLKAILGEERLGRVMEAARRFEYGAALDALDDRTIN